MKSITQLMRLIHAERINSSVNGNPRWMFIARTPSGIVMRFKTASDVQCAYGCDLARLNPSTVIKVEYHWTQANNIIADHWDDGRKSASDLSIEFTALEEASQLAQKAMPSQARNQSRAI